MDRDIENSVLKMQCLDVKIIALSGKMKGEVVFSSKKIGELLLAPK